MFDDDATPDERYLLVEDHCDYCERDGHTFRTCPARDDS